VRLDTEAIVGFEALLRWQHPLHGAISPPDIVLAARETGLLHSLTQAVFHNCCVVIDRLLKAGRSDVRIEMNLSPRELEVGAADKMILDGLQARNLPASMLEIEITEEAPIDGAIADEKLERISGAGIRIVLDDFGTGFSALAFLKDSRIRKIKIDKVFIGDLAKSIADQALVKAVIDLAQTLGIEVMAEGVETDADRRILQSLGCTIAQGFLFSGALPMNLALELKLQRSGDNQGCHTRSSIGL
jgi:EAL domain-containing protein (putative c-di-GMP-specific phosphodiesterase class I)